MKLSAEQKALIVLGAIVLLEAANVAGVFTLNTKINQLAQVKPMIVNVVSASPSASPSLTPTPTASASSRARRL